MRNKKWLKKSSWISFRLRIQRAILGLVSVFVSDFTYATSIFNKPSVDSYLFQ